MARLRNARLQYHNTATAPRQGDGRVTLRPEIDDPLSPAFAPMEERDDMSKARFWAALEKKRKGAQVAGVFE